MEKTATVVNMTIEEAQYRCRFGKGEECCIYLTVGGDGFQCVKNTSLKATLDKRLKTGQMKAKGRGDWDGCACK